MRTVAFLIPLVVASSVVVAAPRPLVPPGWKEFGASSDTDKPKTFVSPDGTARLRVGHIVAHPSDLRGDMDRLAHRDGETITYQRRGSSWLAVSGYREGEIFYRKSNLACAGTRWNTIELRYPREAKAKLDATVTAIAHDMGAYRNDCR
jgi:hypothetical protein